MASLYQSYCCSRPLGLSFKRGWAPSRRSSRPWRHEPMVAHVRTWDHRECIDAVRGCLLAGATADEVRKLIVRRAPDRDFGGEFGREFVSMAMAELDQAPNPISLDHRVCHGHYTSDRQFMACGTKLSGQPRSVTDCSTIRAAKSARAGSARRCLGAKGLSCSTIIPAHEPAWKVRCIRCWGASRRRYIY